MDREPRGFHLDMVLAQWKTSDLGLFIGLPRPRFCIWRQMDDGHRGRLKGARNIEIVYDTNPRPLTAVHLHNHSGAIFIGGFFLRRARDGRRGDLWPGIDIASGASIQLSVAAPRVAPLVGVRSFVRSALERTSIHRLGWWQSPSHAHSFRRRFFAFLRIHRDLHSSSVIRPFFSFLFFPLGALCAITFYIA